MSWRGFWRRVARDGWVWLSLLPLGLGSWAPVVPGLRHRVWWWTTFGVFWAAVTVAGFILPGTLGGGLLLLGWGGGAVTSFVIRVRRRGRQPAPVKQPADLGAVGSVPAPIRPIPGQVTSIPGQVTSIPGQVRPIPAPIGGAAAARSVVDHRDRWPWFSLLPFGLGSWAPLIPAARWRVWWWALAGVAGAAGTIAGFALAAAGASPANNHQTEAGIGGCLLIGAWFGGIAASFAIRSSSEARRGLSVDRPRWPRPTAAARQWSARYGLIAFILAFITIIVLGLILGVAGVQITVGVGVLVVDATLLAALVPLARKRGLSLKDLGVRPTLAIRSLSLVVLAFIVYLVLAALWALAFISHSSAKSAAGELSQINHLGTFQTVVAIVAISVSAPVVEEVFFRGLLYRSLRNRLPVYQAAIVAGALFGFAHITGYPLITLPIKALFGVIACLLYERTGSILPGIALHSFVDASAVDLGLTGNDSIVLAVAGCVVVVLILRATVMKRIRLARAPVVEVIGDHQVVRE